MAKQPEIAAGMDQGWGSASDFHCVFRPLLLVPNPRQNRLTFTLPLPDSHYSETIENQTHRINGSNLIKPNQTKFFSPIRAAGIRCFAPVPPKGDRMNRIYRIKKSRRESSCSSCLSCNPVSIGLWFFAVWCHCVRTSRRPSAIPHSAFTRLAAPPQSR